MLVGRLYNVWNWFERDRVKGHDEVSNKRWDLFENENVEERYNKRSGDEA